MEYVHPSLQDFSTISSFIKKYKNDYKLQDAPSAFYFLALQLILGLQEDEIRDSITDSNFLKLSGLDAGHDRGIDAVYIDDNKEPCTVNLFNFKYTEQFEKTTNHFPSGEIDKILSFLRALFSKDSLLKNDINQLLYSKVEEIWSTFYEHNPNFVIHICSNFYYPFESREKIRFERAVNEYSNFKIVYHLMPNFVNTLTRKGKSNVDARIRAIDYNYFEKSDGDIRALVVDVDIRDLLRIVTNNDELRNNPEPIDYEELVKCDILEDAFEDNVRIYLKQRSKINRNIKKTALSDENHRFFYFNNGITITCDNFNYMKKSRAPIIDIKNIQVVNGSQTIHALYDAFKEQPDKFEEVDILLRIYQTQNPVLSTQIAEYTNSQNPVNSRDIRSIDIVQQKLEQEFLAMGLYYERKNNQYSEKPKELRIDAEKVGQVLMAMYNKMPSEAKTKKASIFADEYDNIFNDSITADKVLLAYKLFERIENEKSLLKDKLLKQDNYEDGGYILFTSYWLLYTLRILADNYSIDLTYNNIENIWNKYAEAKTLIEKIISEEKQNNKKDKYNPATFFKHNKPKKYLDEYENSYINQVAATDG